MQPESAIVSSQEVALAAGVSKPVVSWVVNGTAAQHRVSKATEQRVRAEITRLGYRPGWFVKTLTCSVEHGAGYTEGGVPSVGGKLDGLTTVLATAGYRLVPVATMANLARLPDDGLVGVVYGMDRGALGMEVRDQKTNPPSVTEQTPPPSAATSIRSAPGGTIPLEGEVYPSRAVEESIPVTDPVITPEPSPPPEPSVTVAPDEVSVEPGSDEPRPPEENTTVVVSDTSNNPEPITAPGGTIPLEGEVYPSRVNEESIPVADPVITPEPSPPPEPSVTVAPDEVSPEPGSHEVRPPEENTTVVASDTSNNPEPITAPGGTIPLEGEVYPSRVTEEPIPIFTPPQVPVGDVPVVLGVSSSDSGSGKPRPPEDAEEMVMEPEIMPQQPAASPDDKASIINA